MAALPVQIIRPLSVFVDSEKVAEVTGGSYTINPNRDPVVTDGGYSGHTSGNITAEVQADTLVAITTTGFTKLYNKILSKGYVSIGIPIEANIHECVGAITQLSAKWDHAKGSATGSWTFSGGEPQMN